MTQITGLLAAARDGDAAAANEVFSLLYDQLRALARAKLRQHRTMTLLDTTALLHEAYLKLVGQDALPVMDRRHYMTYAARVMRSVIVDYARARASERRGGDVVHVAIDTGLEEHLAAAPEHDVLRVHEALGTLARAEPRLAQVVELRYFGGLSEAEIGDVLALSERTVRRDWDKARLLLFAALE